MFRFSFACAVLAALVTAQSPVQSTFVGGLVITNTNPQPATALFDVSITDPNGVVVRQIDCNINTAAGTTGTLGVYVTALGGTLVGNELNAAAWTLVATATRTHTGGRTAFVLPTPFYLAPGSYGMALHHVGANPVYTNPVTAGLPSSYSTAEATLNMIAARVRTSLRAKARYGGPTSPASLFCTQRASRAAVSMRSPHEPGTAPAPRETSRASSPPRPRRTPPSPARNTSAAPMPRP